MSNSTRIESRGNFVDGQWMSVTAPTTTLTSINPARPDDLVWSQGVSPEAVDNAVTAACDAFSAWRKRPIDERGALLMTLRERISQHAQALAELISRESGKALWEAHTEIAALRNKIDITVDEAKADLVSRSFPDGSAQISHHPHGVMAVIGPFNFPLSLSHAHIVPALLAGNTVVLKPSDQTPAIAQRYIELFDHFPRGVINLVQGGADVGHRLATHKDVRGVLFTGSYPVGRSLMRDCLDQPNKLLALEMGGKNACIVCPDARYDLALYEASFSAFVTTGQRCTATSRLIVVDPAGALFERIKQDIKHVAENLIVGDPFVASTFMGPLISEQAATRFLQATRELSQFGETLVSATRLSESGVGTAFVSPHVVVAPRQARTSSVFKEELFGPSLSLYHAHDLDEALALANDSDYGLALSVFTSERDTFERCLFESYAGIVNWNKGTVGATGKLPFGGVGKSGNFRPAGSYSVRYCSYPVSTVIGGKPPTRETLPPGFPPDPCFPPDIVES